MRSKGKVVEAAGNTGVVQAEDGSVRGGRVHGCLQSCTSLRPVVVIASIPGTPNKTTTPAQKYTYLTCEVREGGSPAVGDELEFDLFTNLVTGEKNACRCVCGLQWAWLVGGRQLSMLCHCTVSGERTRARTRASWPTTGLGLYGNHEARKVQDGLPAPQPSQYSQNLGNNFKSENLNACRNHRSLILYEVRHSAHQGFIATKYT